MKKEKNVISLIFIVIGEECNVEGYTHAHLLTRGSM